MECFGEEQQLGRKLLGCWMHTRIGLLGGWLHTRIGCICLTFLQCVFSNGEEQLRRRGRREPGTSSAIRELLCVWAGLPPVGLSVELCEHKNLVCG